MSSILAIGVFLISYLDVIVLLPWLTPAVTYKPLLCYFAHIDLFMRFDMCLCHIACICNAPCVVCSMMDIV